MPELPEVETVCRQLYGALKNAVIEKVTLRRKNLRAPFPVKFTETLTGRTIKDIQRRAKYLLFILDSDDVLIAHLGMTGRFSVLKKPPKAFASHDHVVMHLKDGRCIVYNDARRFGLMALAKKDQLKTYPLFAELGPEPLEKKFSQAYLKKELGKRKTPVKVALMDQKLVVGVGNIYASEALFLAGINPSKPAMEAAGKASVIITAIHKVLNDAIASGGSSLRDFVHVSGEAGYFQHHFNVYGRKGKPCFRCGVPIRSTRMAGRSTFFCPQCQA